MKRDLIGITIAVVVMITVVMSITSAQANDLKDSIVTEVNTKGTKYYGRNFVTGDFNNDGVKEMLYWRMADKYMDYHWSKAYNITNVPYHNKGRAMAKANPAEWNSVIMAHHVNEYNRRGYPWKVTFNGSAGCIQPSQVIPTTLNQDQYTDFVIVCHGYDAKPWLGEHSLVAISDGPDNYNVEAFTDKIGFYHDGDVADFNNDGFMDILLVDQAKSKKAFVYLNNGSGKFKKSNKYFSSWDKWENAYGTEILDVNGDGYFDVAMFGHEQNSWKDFPTMILLGNANNKFSKKNSIRIPKVTGWGTVFDMMVDGDNLFVLRSPSNGSRGKGRMVQQVNLNTMKTVGTIQDSKFKLWDRIFRKGSNKFGGLMTGDYGGHDQTLLDFTVSGGVIKKIN